MYRAEQLDVKMILMVFDWYQFSILREMTDRVRVLLFGLWAIFLSQTVSAEVRGLCSDCHTMHYSQGGEVPAGWGQEGPYRFLTVSDCVGCHSSTGGQTIVNGTPIVFNTSLPTSPLAGGNFYWVMSRGDNYGHNVLSIPGVEEDGRNPGPPGFTVLSPSRDSCGYCHGGDGSNESWLCDCTSCHVPRHHTPDHPDGNYKNVVDGSGGFYRFLGRQKDNRALPSQVYDNIKSFHNNPGVKGIEDPDWERTCSATDHNEYPGETSHSGPFGGGYESISDWCAGCHGYFHYLSDQSAVGSGSPWLRHPTDYAIPNEGEFRDAYGAGGSGQGTYNPLIPVARPNIDAYDGSGPSDKVNLGTDQVQCLSCHRAHGSPYPDMLRWDYRNWPGGGTNGCAVCHTSKD